MQHPDTVLAAIKKNRRMVDPNHIYLEQLRSIHRKWLAEGCLGTEYGRCSGGGGVGESEETGGAAKASSGGGEEGTQVAADDTAANKTLRSDTG
jgi:hypothetical protein